MAPVPDQSSELDAVNAAIAWMKSFEAMCVAFAELERAMEAYPPGTQSDLSNAELDEARRRFAIARPKLVAAADLVLEFAGIMKPVADGSN